MKWSTAVVISLVSAVCLVPQQDVLADQPRRDPPPVKTAVEEPDIQAWAAAYEALNYPRVLVLCGRTSHSGADGLFAPASSGFAYQLKSAFETIINDAEVNLDLIDTDSLISASDRLANALDMSDEPTAVRLLANDVEADMVILIKFIDHDPRAAPGAIANMTFEVVDVTRGRKLLTFPFRWTRGDDVTWIKRYANDLAVKFINDFSRRAPKPNWINVRAINFGDNPGHLKAFRDSLSEMDGVVGRLRPPRSSQHVNPLTGNRENVQTHGVRFTGDILDLAAAIEDATFDIDGREVQIVQLESSSLTVKMVTPPPVITSTGKPLKPLKLSCEEALFRTDAYGKKAISAIQDLYENKDSPSFALLVNRAPTRNERVKIESSGGSVSGDTIVVVQTDASSMFGGGNGAQPGQQDEDDSELRSSSAFESQTYQIEAAMYDLLGKELLGFKRIDPNAARSRLAASMDRQEKIFGEDEIVEILRQQKIADIIIFGRGATIAESDGAARVNYTFRVVSLSDASYLAGAIVNGTLGRGQDKDMILRMARDAITQIACELREEWSPPTEMLAEIKGAKDSADMNEFLKAVKRLRDLGEDDRGKLDTRGTSSYEGGADKGVIQVSLEYHCAFSELFDEFKRLSGELSYSLQINKLETNHVELSIVRD